MDTKLDTDTGYQAARDGAAFLVRPGRRFLEISGRAPGDMLKGILSGKIPGAAQSFYSTVLTPKGKMVTDLRILPGPSGGFLLDVPEAGFPGLEAHLKKYLHPRFAQAVDRSRELSMISVVGPRGVDVVGNALGIEGFATELRWPEAPTPESGDALAELPPHPSFGRILVLSNRELGVPALDLILEAGVGRRPEMGSGASASGDPDPVDPPADLPAALLAAGAVPLSTEAWEVLRIEAGTPAFGQDMTEDTIPVEAGIHLRAVDYQKGCYTGQEVIVRLRDRGKVNKHLRRILLGGAPVPEPGTELFPSEGDRSLGWVTSACASPRFGQTVALGYLKRGVEPGDAVRIGSPQGSPGRVEAL